MIPIYCVNLETSKGRHDRMKRRFDYHNLNAKFVKALPYNSSLLDYYLQGMNDAPRDDKSMRGFACYASHLKAVREMVSDSCEAAIICEDDVLIRNDFKEKLEQVLENAPKKHLITLCYMMERFDRVTFVGHDSSLKNILTVDPEYTWGAQGYYLSKDYAIKLLTTYDRPWNQVVYPHQCPENFIRLSDGYMAYPPLVIEDGIDSDRASEDLPYHHHHFRFWGYENYNETEEEHISPLKEDS